MIKADKSGDELYLYIVNDCLIKGKCNFFEPTKKVYLDIGLSRTKKIRKAVAAMKQDRQAIGLMLGGRSEPRGGDLVPCFISTIKHLQIQLLDKIQSIISVTI